jgi:hypothetical protein
MSFESGKPSTEKRALSTALKEWSAVIAALDRGLQIFLLRKGGIVEGRRGFQLLHPEFLLFPTFEHQHARSLKPEYLDLLAPQPDGHIGITHMARVTDVRQGPSSPAGMRAVAECYIWNEEFIRQRYEYRPDLPLYMLLVRAYRLRQPQLIPLRASYAGCKSWVHLTEEVAVDGAQPVLDEPEFAEQRQKLLSAIATSEGLENRKQAPE